MTSIQDQIRHSFRKHLPSVDFCSLRYVSTDKELIRVSSDSLDEHQIMRDMGVCISVIHKGGAGYSATSRLDSEGIRCAIDQAVQWADLCSKSCIINFDRPCLSPASGEYISHESQPWGASSLSEKISLLTTITKSMKAYGCIVGRFAGMERVRQNSVQMFADGEDCQQIRKWVAPYIYVLAHKQGETQTRSWGGANLSVHSYQGGLEGILSINRDIGRELIEEVLQLMSAPECPTQYSELLVMPDQMAMQIHESIGHPLELDRILGDERNMAGTSFVTTDMVGSYRYGSERLNVSFDPTMASELGSYGWDDEGYKAEKKLLIENGILKRVLGGQVSQGRTDVPGVACSRADNWYRPPVDRMGNINIEPGETALEEMIGSVEDGVLVSTNRSWSIDDSCNKFQFGCEWGERIINGERAGVVKNPNYRGISSSFWRSLQSVGNKDTFDVFGTPYCGKGEPGQTMTVGHASPACLFRDVDVFGGGHA